MIGPQHEQPQSSEAAGFFDSVSIDFSDPEQALFGLAWVTRLPSESRSRADLLLFSGTELVDEIELESDQLIGDWADARLDGVRVATGVPLEQWSLEAGGSRASVNLEATALSSPLEVADRSMQEAVGIEQYEQLCTVTGAVTVDGDARPIHGLGRRVHWWGSFDWERFERWRSLYAVSQDGRAISFASALPANSSGHGDELRSAAFLQGEDELPFEEVLLSTIYGEDGLPAAAGLELRTHEDEIPRRFGGEAICGLRTERRGHELTVSFLQWSIEGRPAYGCYEVARR
jgi:hypothetical protein